MKFRMNHTKIGWLLMLTLFPYSNGYGLSYGNETCDCFERGWKYWEIFCPNEKTWDFGLVLYTSDLALRNFGHLTCGDAILGWSNFEVKPSESLYEVDVLEIIRCPLPDVTFAEIVRKLGLRNVKNVTYSSDMKLNSSMMDRHLLDLGTIEYLCLSFNGFTELPSDLLCDVTEIREVDLSFNEITTLPLDLFDGLRNLLIINLNYNRIEMIDWRMFGNCRSLKFLYLRGNFLATLDDHIFRNAELIYLDVAENQLETLPNHISEPRERLTLNISANKFALLPDKLFDGVSITDLIFSDNFGNLTTLPDYWLSNLTHLERVILARNALTVLPETIFWGDSQLQIVDLGGNDLSSIPEDIFRDTKELAFLDLSGNILDSLPENLFRGLSKLGTINLESNNLKNISEKLFAGLLSLTDLNLAFNSIATIHEAAFEDLLSLRVVRLSHNFLTLSENLYAGRRRFVEFSNIQEILLDHNNLNGSFSIQPLDHNHKTNLRFVNLSYNQISYVQISSPLVGSQDLIYDFRHNNLRMINVSCEIFFKVDIFVDDNPLDCGCAIYDSLEYMHEFKEPKSGENVDIIVGNASCSEPTWMKGTPVASLQLETFSCRPDHYDHMRCAEGCDCGWRPDDGTRIVNCSSRNITKMPNETIEIGRKDDSQEQWMLDTFVKRQNRCSNWYNSPVELDLGNNSLTEIPALNISTYKYVKSLILSHNYISNLSFSVLPPKLKSIHLSYNYMKRLPQSALTAIIRSATLRKLNLERNPWSCDSDTRRALDSMEKKLGPNLRYSTMKCLDHRSPPSIDEKSTLYISYTVF